MVVSDDGQLRPYPEGQGNQPESSAAAYAGLLATLLVAPLAWCSRRHRSLNILWIVLGLISLAWVFDIPGLVTLLRIPGLNIMSHNRFVFAATFAVIAMTAVGLEVLLQGPLSRRWWFVGPMAVLLGLGGFCLVRIATPPEGVATILRRIVEQGGHVEWIHDVAGVQRVQQTYLKTYAVGALLCGLALAGWLLLVMKVQVRRWFVPAMAVLLVADLLWFAYGRSSQCDPALYYPPIPALDAIAKATPGRVIGVGCFPAELAITRHLYDVRGYDGIDPVRFTELLSLAADPRSPKISYALTQLLVPKYGLQPFGVRLHPVLDMLNVQYAIFRGAPPAGCHPDFAGPDYWVMANPNALSRVYVPWRVETIEDDKERLARMADLGFNPAHVAYIEPAGQKVDFSTLCEGTAAIVDEIPTRVTVSLDMKTPGLVVLADRWDKGWNAYLDGRPAPILRTNHALRGVVAPAGKATLEFRYEPASFAWGLRLAAVGLLATLGWFGVGGWIGRSVTPLPLPPPSALPPRPESVPTPAKDQPSHKSKKHRRGRRN